MTIYRGVRLACVFAIALAAACTAPPRSGGVAPSATSPLNPLSGASAEPAPRAGATVYRIDPQASEIRVLVYRGGALATMGHNHVLALHPDRGWVESVAGVSGDSFYLQFPLEAVVVDDTALRRQEGADFPGEIPAEAKQGTAHNMLGENLLDAPHHPLLSIRSAAISARGDMLTAIVHLTVAGHTSNVSAQFKLQESADGLTASGQLTLRQSELGLKPFSIMLGALQVQDQMVVKFRMVATRI